MHHDRFGQANSLAHEALDAGAQRQMFPLYLLGVVLAWAKDIELDIPLVGTLVSGIITRDAKWSQEPFPLEKDRILAAALP